MVMVMPMPNAVGNTNANADANADAVGSEALLPVLEARGLGGACWRLAYVMRAEVPCLAAWSRLCVLLAAQLHTQERAVAYVQCEREKLRAPIAAQAYMRFVSTPVPPGRPP